MPFTVSHVAVVVPVYRPLTRLHVFSAAVIGSMVPDFGMLLPGSLARWQTHSVFGLFTFCLPVGLLAYALTQWLIKPAITAVAPPAAYARLRSAHPPAPLNRPRHWVYVIGALLLGALTHLIWDGFTHEDGRGARMFPGLTDYGPDVGGHLFRVYAFNQYASSVVGLLIVIGALFVWLRHASQMARTPASALGALDATQPALPSPQRLARTERYLWMALYLVIPIAAIAGPAVRMTLHGHSLFQSRFTVGFLAVAGVRGLAFSLIAVSALLRARLGD